LKPRMALTWAGATAGSDPFMHDIVMQLVAEVKYVWICHSGPLGQAQGRPLQQGQDKPLRQAQARLDPSSLDAGSSPA
jgi:hypothetical protein